MSDPTSTTPSPAVRDALFQANPSATPAQQAAIYPQSVASGDPRPDGIVLDQWDGYQQERNAILNVVKHGNIRNFVALTGDLHTFLAGYLKTDFDNPLESHVGIELMVGSITSSNFSEEIEAEVPLPSRPVPAKQFKVAPALLSSTIRAANPWIEFFNSSTHGYGLLTLTPQQLVCEFKSVSTITEPTTTLIPLATFTIPVNQVKLNKS